MKPQTITVLGAGYVGLTTAALLANAGYRVYVIEPNQERLTAIQSGKSFFYEAGINPLIKKALDEQTLIPTNSYEQSVPGSDIVISAVGTPDNPDGSSNLNYVFTAAKSAAQFMHDETIFVQKSTVPVGTGQHIEALFETASVRISYVSNPEFLREGTGVYDTLYPDRVVTGATDQKAAEKILDLYRTLASHREAISGITGSDTPPSATLEPRYIATSLPSAELIKVTSNAFLALKISFSNSIAKLSDAVGADITDVMDAVGADTRIGRAFLNAGRGYGGGCFPKDVSGLIASGLEHGIHLDVMQASQAVNQSMPSYVVEKLQDAVGSLEGKTVAVLGLAFKAGTSDVRKSPGIAIANSLVMADATVITYDPQAAEEASKDLYAAAHHSDTIDDAIRGSDAVVLATEWDEITSYPAERFAELMSGTILVDAINSYGAATAKEHGLHYIGVGRR